MDLPLFFSSSLLRWVSKVNIYFSDETTDTPS